VPSSSGESGPLIDALIDPPAPPSTLAREPLREPLRGPLREPLRDPLPKVALSEDTSLKSTMPLSSAAFPEAWRTMASLRACQASS
jgi:hypothetical protein